MGGGELDSLAGLGKGNPIQDEIPEACPGPYWFSSSIIQPITTEPTSVMDLPLSSDSETIRQRLIDSKVNWRTVFVDAMITHIDGDATVLTHANIWFVDPDKSREVYDLDNDNLVDMLVYTNNQLQTIVDLKTGQETT